MGQPRIMYESQDFPFEIVQKDRKLLFAYQWNRQPRFVYVDEPVTAVSPVFYGYSTGHWRGATLAVETTGLDDSTLLDRSGLPHSDALRILERYRLQNGGRQLEVRYTFTDPRSFSQPWEARIVYDRVPDGRIREDICVERLGLFKKN
jgi:hypothetical protein